MKAIVTAIILFFAMFIFWGLDAKAAERVGGFAIVFLEEKDITNAENVSFTVHPVSDANNSVLVLKNEEWKGLWYMVVAAIPREKEVRVWYQRVEKSLPVHLDRRVLCFGLIDEQGCWTAPDLNLYPVPWDSKSNVVMLRSRKHGGWGGFNVHQILLEEAEKASDKRYKMLYWDAAELGDNGGMLAFSPDGIHWKKDNRTRAIFTEHNDAFTLLKDPACGKYILYQTKLEDWKDKPIKDNIGSLRRIITIRESKDLVHWTAQEVILRPDKTDPPTTEFYLLKVFPYYGRQVGLVMKYFADPKAVGKHSGIIESELVLSDDGRTWRRPYRETDLGLWTYADPFILKDDLCFIWWKDGSLWLARYRRDGLVSCGTKAKGHFTTSVFIAPGENLCLNASAPAGVIAVGVLDRDGKVIPGFEKDKCTFRKVDGTTLTLCWEGTGTEALAGKPIRLQFHLENAHIYAVW